MAETIVVVTMERIPEGVSEATYNFGVWCDKVLGVEGRKAVGQRVMSVEGFYEMSDEDQYNVIVQVAFEALEAAGAV